MTKQELQEENNYLMEQLIRTTFEYLDLKDFIQQLKKYYVMKPKYNKKTVNHLGASFNRRANKYEARIRINGKKQHLGYYETSSEAGAAYMVASMNKQNFTNPKDFRLMIKEEIKNLSK